MKKIKHHLRQKSKKVKVKQKTNEVWLPGLPKESPAKHRNRHHGRKNK